MKRFLLCLLVLLLTLQLSACGERETEQERVIRPAELTAAEEELLRLMSGDVFIWDYEAPEGAQYFTCRLQLYRDGQVVEGEQLSVYTFEMNNLEGRVEAALSSTANTAFGSNLGQRDFFDHVSQTKWQVRFTDNKNSGTAAFHTGFDLVDKDYPRDEPLELTRWDLQGEYLMELDREYILLCYALEEGKAGSGLDAGKLALNNLKDYSYAYVLTCSFSETKG